MKNDKIVLYMHAGSDNHGCEAIANTLIKMLPKPAVLISSRKAEIFPAGTLQPDYSGKIY